MASAQLRFRGITPMQIAVAVVTTAPLGLLAWQAWEKKLGFVDLVASQGLLVGAALLIAVLPWMSRFLSRMLYRARVDDIAIYVRGDALPWRTIQSASVERSARRTLLRLRRSETVELLVVLRDLYAGHLEPLGPLVDKLRQHGHDVDL